MVDNLTPPLDLISGLRLYQAGSTAAADALGKIMLAAANTDAWFEFDALRAFCALFALKRADVLERVLAAMSDEQAEPYRADVERLLGRPSTAVATKKVIASGQALKSHAYALLAEDATTGDSAYYFLLVSGRRRSEFEACLVRGTEIDLSEFGELGARGFRADVPAGLLGQLKAMGSATAGDSR